MAISAAKNEVTNYFNFPRHGADFGTGKGRDSASAGQKGLMPYLTMTGLGLA
jgi:hypothetical protein